MWKVSTKDPVKINNGVTNKSFSTVVSRPDFMGLGLVSQRSLSRGSKVSVSLETTLSRPQDLKEEQNEKERHEKSTQSAVDSHIPSEKMMFFVLTNIPSEFCVIKYLTRKILGLGLGLGLGL